jgi:N-acetyl-anhydromuramyl-L-alanine amidase AmpD
MGKQTKTNAEKPKANKNNKVSLVRKKERVKNIAVPAADNILHLQHTLGNQAVQKFFKSGTPQAKLKIGKPNDKYELEADRIADQVMSMPEPKISRQTEEEEEEEPMQAKLLSAERPTLQRQAGPEEEEKEEEPIQTKLESSRLQRQAEPEEEEEEEEPIQAKGNSSSTAVATAGIESSVNSLKGGGQPLLESTRNYFEPRFGYDFSGVRVHKDSKANEAARAINAKAFTKGKDIILGTGQYSPESSTGKRLLAHELTHVVQQNSNLRSGSNLSSTIQRQPTKWVLDAGKVYTDRAGAVTRGRELQQTYTNIEIVKHGPKKFQVRYKNPLPVHISGFPKVDTGYYYKTNPEAEERAKVLRAYGYDVETFKRSKDNFFQCRIKGLLGRKPKLPIAVGFDAGYRYKYVASARKRLAALQKVGYSGELRKVGTNHQVWIKSLPTFGGTSKAAPAKAGAKATKRVPSVSKPKPVTKPAGKLTPVAPTSGHLPTKDYGKGKVLERSFLRKADKKTKRKQGKYLLFFENGEEVKLLNTSKFWIEVEGEVYYDKKNPKKFEKKDASGRKKPVRMSGWIKRAWTNMTIGKFKGLGIEDVTRTYGKLGHTSYVPPRNIKNVILHRTGSGSSKATLNSFATTIRRGGHVGAHYLIGKGGKIYLIVPIRRSVSHVGKRKTGMAHITSTTSIGIEHVGTAYRLKNRPKSYKDVSKMKKVRDEIKKLSLTPALKANLLKLSDRDLRNQLKWSEWWIYQDMPGAQKRATYLLVGRLMKEFGLTLNDIVAHEKASAKTIGEGQNIKEFLVAMRDYKIKVKRLKKRASTEAGLKKIAKFMGIVTYEENLVKALDLDKTDAENAELAKEKAAKVIGPASKREKLRVRFYNQFFRRVNQLDKLLSLIKPAAYDVSKINTLVSKWLK